MQQEVYRRRVALTDARLSPGLTFWLARQRRRWRLARLSPEQTKLLRLAGVEMDAYDVDQWREEAHRAACYLLGSRILLDGGAASSSGIDMAPSMGGGAAPKRWPSGTRLKVERWLETQQALFAERRLSRAQLHYLAMLELTWLVGKEACALRQAAWRPQLGHLASSGGVGGQVKDREQRLQLQRALRLLGWGSAHNPFDGLGATGAILEEFGGHSRTEEDREWDAQLTQLLAFRRESGTWRLPVEGLVAAPGLSNWLSHQMDRWRDQRLPERRITQLMALGVDPPQLRPVTYRQRALV